LEDGDRPDQGPVASVLQHGRVERHVSRVPLELEGLDHPVGGGVTVEDAVEPEAVALVVLVDVAPPSAVAELVGVDLHLVATGSQPLREQLRLPVRPEDDIAGSFHLPLGPDLV
jgi:hypothetical protein